MNMKRKPALKPGIPVSLFCRAELIPATCYMRFNETINTVIRSAMVVVIKMSPRMMGNINCESFNLRHSTSRFWVGCYLDLLPLRVFVPLARL